MGKKTILFESEEYRSISSVAAFLRELADKLEQGEVVLRQGEKEITVSIPQNVELEIEVQEKPKRGKTQQELEIELEWIKGEEGGPVTLG